jgi:hypothetical protein
LDSVAEFVHSIRFGRSHGRVDVRSKALGRLSGSALSAFDTLRKLFVFCSFAHDDVESGWAAIFFGGKKGQPDGVFARMLKFAMGVKIGVNFVQFGKRWILRHPAKREHFLAG